jgi:hypothetical protein
MSRKNKEAERETRRKKVAANMLAGLNYRDMSEALGVSVGTIGNDAKVVLDRWRSEQVETVDEWVLMSVRRIDRAINAIWEPVSRGDLRAIDRFVKLEERRARLLGLDAPSSNNVDVTSSGKRIKGYVVVSPDDWGGDG